MIPPLPSGHAPRATLFWAGFHLRRLLARRAFKVWAVLIVLFLLLARFVARSHGDELGRAVVLSLTPLLALFYGTGTLREEIEDQTLTYSFTRPVGREWLYAARVLAAAGPPVLLVVPAALFAGFDVGQVTALRFVVAATLGAAAYSGFFALIGQLIKWPAWFGLLFLLFWEGGVGTVPGFLGRLTLMTHVRAIAGLRVTETPWSGLWEAPPPLASALALAAAAGIFIWLGGARVRRKEFVLTR